MNKYDYIYDKLKERVDANLLPGFSLAIAENGKEVYRRHLNYNGNEIFRLASLTKPVTAIAAIKAEELGLININDKISKYLDGFTSMKVGKVVDGKVECDYLAKTEITIKHILHHQSGIGSGIVGDIQTNNRKAPSSLKEAVDGYKNWYLDFEPGSKSVYSGVTALDIVAYIIELTSKMPYFEFLKKYILDPLDMKDTTYRLDENQKNRLAKMYDMTGDENHRIMFPIEFGSYSGFDGFTEGFPGGAASLMSSLDDYFKLAIMLANKGVYNGKRIIAEKEVIKMGTDIIPLPCPGVDEFVNWGYGVYVRGNKADFQPLKKGTFGWSGAYSPHMFVNIKDNIAVLFMTNLTNDGGSGSPNIKVLEKAFSEVVDQIDE